MSFSQPIPKEYDHPAKTVIRTSVKSGLGGAASTVYGRERFFHHSIVRAVYGYVTVADTNAAEGGVNSTWQAYYSPGATPDGSADVAIGAAWSVGTGAAGTTVTISLKNLTASGALTVDGKGYPVFAPGDSIYFKSGPGNEATGRIDLGYEFQWTKDAGHN